MSPIMNKLIVLLISAALVLVIWSGGWLAYDQLEIWQTIEENLYQNFLLLVTGIQSVAASVIAIKLKAPLTNIDKKELNKIFKRAVKQIQPEVKAHGHQLDILREDIADIKLAIKAAPAKEDKEKSK